MSFFDAYNVARMKSNPLLWLLLILSDLVVIVAALPFVIEGYPFLHVSLRYLTLVDVNYGVGALAGFIMYLVMLPRRKGELALVLLGGALLDAYLISLRLPLTSWRAQVFHLGIGCFYVCLLASMWRCVVLIARGENEEAVRCLEFLGLGLTLPILFLFNTGRRPEESSLVYDGLLMATDGMTGTQPSFVISAFLRSSGLLNAFMYFIYFYIAMWMLLAQLLAYLCQRGDIGGAGQPFNVPAFTFIIATIFGVLTYLYFPAVGTEAFCGTGVFPNGPWPDCQSHLEPIMAPGSLPRNAMPSLHLTWILCAYFSVRPLKRKYGFIWLVLSLLTLLSAFSVGCHWLTDFVVALPFTAMIMGLTFHRAPALWRLIAVVAGAMASYGIIYAIKEHIQLLVAHPSLCVALAVAIAVGSWLICLRLSRPVKPGLNFISVSEL